MGWVIKEQKRTGSDFDDIVFGVVISTNLNEYIGCIIVWHLNGSTLIS